ncbi:MAG: hypothetical protein H6R42_25, partial [Nitrospirae bacterium]|nr:hypothetical protein [Nitrospirota bacterium]
MPIEKLESIFVRSRPQNSNVGLADLNLGILGNFYSDGVRA